MKVLFICNCSPWKEGGAETRSREIALRLIEQGHTVTILCAKVSLSDPVAEERQGVRIVYKPVLPSFILKHFQYPHYLPLALAKIALMPHVLLTVLREKYDLIREDISPFPPSGLLALVKLPARQRIAVVHNLSGSLQGWVKLYGLFYGLGGYMMDALLRGGRLKYDRIICDGEWFARELAAHPDIAQKVAYIPNGVDLYTFNNGTRKRRQDGHIRLLSVGRLVETKGHAYLIEALSLLKDKYQNMQLDILGDGPLKKELIAQAARRRVADICRMRSPVPHTEMPQVYAEYDFLILPSVFEGLPLTMLEAMATKLPIIASDISAHKSVLDENSAVFFRSCNARDLADRLEWALHHPAEVAARAETAYRMVQNYDWSQITRQEIGTI